ncbi:sulfite exporter TauE/SafE family protein [uncultured Shimia sp.]|uniref:sulfite exporter TauE/SafE family protein n=1 Tax=uncultured Shimia sp. TaxID=573152 RepID=UPI002613062E|nr:sulfite exporter TauE/SafE family protein [uncultured Shimia sp.]
MDSLFSILSPSLFAVAIAVAVLSGVVKGIVGFGMPMILISGLTTFLSPELALAGLIAPTVGSNLMQATRNGPSAALASVKQFRVFLIAGFCTMVLSAQLVRVIPQDVFLLIIGIPVASFALIQLVGYELRLPRPSFRLEAAIGAFAGAIGGLSGMWGPPTVMYLTSLGTEKTEQIRVQGVIYGLGALTLVGAHIGSGILNAKTVPLTMALLIPALVGMWIGGRIQDRIDQATFRKVTLIVLCVAALNIVRKGIVG